MSTLADTLNQPIDLLRMAQQLAALVGCRPQTRQRRGKRRRARLPSAQQAPDSRFDGCGWFDSSRELSHGLEVVEHRDGALLAEGLPLPVWLHHALLEDDEPANLPADRPAALPASASQASR